MTPAPVPGLDQAPPINDVYGFLLVTAQSPSGLYFFALIFLVAAFYLLRIFANR
jgi:hypothetical protein